MSFHENTNPDDNRRRVHEMLHDLDFLDRVDELHDAADERQAAEEARQRTQVSRQEARQEALQRLAAIARAVAQAAGDKDGLEKTHFFRREEKSRFGKFLNNGGDTKHVAGEEGWIIYPALGNTPSSIKDGFASKGGPGLVLTEEGELFMYTKESDPKFARKDRAELERRTFIAKDSSLLPEQTLLPRPGSEPRPTMLLAINDPANQLATDLVVEQCFEGLASFVQQEDL